MTHEEDHIALVDLDGTVADCDGALRDAMQTLRSPGERLMPIGIRAVPEPPYIEARRKMVSVPARILAEPEKDPAWLRSRGRTSEDRFSASCALEGTEEERVCVGEKPNGRLSTCPTRR